MKIRSGVVSVLVAGMTAWPAFSASVPQAQQTTASLASMAPEDRGDLLMVRGEYLAAVEAYRQAPQDAHVLKKLGIAYHHMLAIDLAKKDYQKALLMRPNYPEAINNLGAAYFDKHDYRRAIRLYQKALELMPKSAVVAANLGTAYFARGDFKPGLAAYRVAFTLDPDVFNANNPQVIAGPTRAEERAHQDYCIAELFAQAGMKERALEYLRKAFDEGFKDRNKLMEDAVFTQLRQTSEFAQLMAEQKIH
jgi:tetratricopeptide (TPR) repeat protein